MSDLWGKGIDQPREPVDKSGEGLPNRSRWVGWNCRKKGITRRVVSVMAMGVKILVFRREGGRVWLIRREEFIRGTQPLGFKTRQTTKTTVGVGYQYANQALRGATSGRTSRYLSVNRMKLQRRCVLTEGTDKIEFVVTVVRNQRRDADREWRMRRMRRIGRTGGLLLSINER